MAGAAPPPPAAGPARTGWLNTGERQALTVLTGSLTDTSTSITHRPSRAAQLPTAACLPRGLPLRLASRRAGFADHRGRCSADRGGAEPDKFRLAPRVASCCRNLQQPSPDCRRKYSGPLVAHTFRWFRHVAPGL